MKKEYVDFSYLELCNFIDFVYCLIKDKGRSNNIDDYVSITLSLITLKRFVDIRAEYKKNYIYDNDLNKKIANVDYYLYKNKSQFPEFNVYDEKIDTYRIEWDDIASYNGKSDIALEYHDGLGGNKFEARFENKAFLIKECIESFNNITLKNLFKNLNFVSKVFGTEQIKQVLDLEDFETIIIKLNKYNFDLEHTTEDIFNHSYMHLIGNFSNDSGKKNGEFYTPTSVVQGCIKFLNMDFINKKIIVSDLTSGVSTFMVEFGNFYKKLFKKSEYCNNNFNDYIKFVTGEKETISKVIGDANMLSSGYGNNYKSFNLNSITEYDEGLGEFAHKVDIALANPPYGIKDYGYGFASAQKEKSRWSFGVPNKGEGEYAFILTILDMLNDTGKAVVVLPLGTLFKDITSNHRQKILEKDWLEGIILLPKSMFHTTGIPVCLWVINKKKEQEDQNRVFMINASNDFTKNGKLNEWNDEKSSEVYKNREEIEGYSTYVDMEKIQKNKFNLSIARYISGLEIEEDINIVALQTEIIELEQSIQQNKVLMNSWINQIVALGGSENE